MDKRLYCVVPVFNPCRYESRIKLYKEFEKYVNDSGAILVVVEAVQHKRDHILTVESNNFHFQYRTDSHLWIKERLINLVMRQLPSDWYYMCWLDADIKWARDDWANETVELLQHYEVIQMFDKAIDLDPLHSVKHTPVLLRMRWN